MWIKIYSKKKGGYELLPEVIRIVSQKDIIKGITKNTVIEFNDLEYDINDFTVGC